jgi:methyl-accepting chemotaxis protein
MAQAEQIIAQEFMPAGATYVAKMNDLVERQQAAIDEIGATIHQRSTGSAWMIVVLSTASIALALLLGWLISRSLLKQLGGEPGYAAGITDRIAGGDLTVHVQLAPGDRSSLLYSIAAMRDRLAAIVREVRHSTEAVATASDEIASGNLDLSTRTEQQAGALEETASSMEELTATVKQNTEFARQANSWRQRVRRGDARRRGGGGVVSTMEAISASSRQIVDIIGVIDGIAFQTNILALNAAVEAARRRARPRLCRGGASAHAGAALGQRGQGHQAADRRVGGQDRQRQQLVDEAGKTMDEVVRSVSVSEIMAQITAASSEQRPASSRSTSAIIEMDGVTQQNAALVEEASAAASAMQDQAAHLAQLVSVFKVDAATHTASVTPIGQPRAHAAHPAAARLPSPAQHAPAPVGLAR